MTASRTADDVVEQEASAGATAGAGRSRRARVALVLARLLVVWVAMVTIVAVLRDHPQALLVTLVAVGVASAVAVRKRAWPVGWVAVAACGAFGEWVVIAAGAWHYPGTGDLSIPLWLPALWYVAVVRVFLVWESITVIGEAGRRAPTWPALSTDTIRLEVAAAVAFVVAARLLWDSPYLLAAVTLVLGAFMLKIRRSRRLAAVYVAGAVMGTAGEVLFTHLDVWVYAEPNALQVPIWLPLAWGLVYALVVRVATSDVRYSEGRPDDAPVLAPSVAGGPAVCAVVPARDEAPTVGAVVRTLRTVPAVGEVLVVDNGSSDGTAAVARSAGATVVAEPVVGKGEAMMRGAASTDAEILLFVDADLVGLDRSHVEVLLASVASGQSDMACGLWDRGRAWNWVLCHFVPIVTGQRAVRREFFAGLPPAGASGYRVEAALNAHVARLRGRRAHCILSGLGHQPRAVKVGSRPAGTAHVWRVTVIASWAAVVTRVGLRGSGR